MQRRIQNPVKHLRWNILWKKDFFFCKFDKVFESFFHVAGYHIHLNPYYVFSISIQGNMEGMNNLGDRGGGGGGREKGPSLALVRAMALGIVKCPQHVSYN